MRKKAKTIQVDANLYYSLMENKHILKRKKFIRVYDIGWRRKAVLKTNDDATLYIAEKLEEALKKNKELELRIEKIEDSWLYRNFFAPLGYTFK